MFLPRRDRMFRLQHLGRPLAAVGGEDAEGARHRVRRQVLAGLDQFEQLLEQPDRDRVVGRAPGDGDLVAADVDVAVEALLDDAQQLVAGAEQRDHGLLAGHDDDSGDAIRTRCWIGQVRLSGRQRGTPSTVPATCADFAGSAGRPAHRAAGQHVRVDVEDALPDLGAGVEHGAEVLDAQPAGRPRGCRRAARALARRRRAPRSAMSVKCSRGTTSTWVGACGLRSSKA